MTVECSADSCQYRHDGRCRAPRLQLGRKTGSGIRCLTYLPFWDSHKVKLCPHCGSVMSEPREYQGILWRHCYSCHFETKEEDL